ncbi:MAG: hypothetical protein KF770_27695 [Anaerolineae bacterium]|nr:hypothetical protein [Anaerolineae bacterium]
MNEMMDKQKSVKQGWRIRIATAVFEKLFNTFCTGGMGLSPYASQEFFYYSGCGWEEAWMYQSIVRTKLYEGEF